MDFPFLIHQEQNTLFREHCFERLEVKREMRQLQLQSFREHPCAPTGIKWTVRGDADLSSVPKSKEEDGSMDSGFSCTWQDGTEGTGSHP